MARSSVERQWTRDSTVQTLTPLAPVKSYVLVSDPESPTLNANMLLLRSFLTVNIRVENLQNDSNGNWFSLGLLRCDPNVPTTQLGPLTASAADRSWLFRQDYRLLWQLNAQAFSGQVDLNGEPYHLDWAYRSGKGTNVNKDVELRLMFELRAFGATNVWVAVQMLHLWQTDG